MTSRKIFLFLLAAMISLNSQLFALDVGDPIYIPDSAIWYNNFKIEKEDSTQKTLYVLIEGNMDIDGDIILQINRIRAAHDPNHLNVVTISRTKLSTDFLNQYQPIHYIGYNIKDDYWKEVLGLKRRIVPLFIIAHNGQVVYAGQNFSYIDLLINRIVDDSNVMERIKEGQELVRSMDEMLCDFEDDKISLKSITQKIRSEPILHTDENGAISALLFIWYKWIYNSQYELPLLISYFPELLTDESMADARWGLLNAEYRWNYVINRNNEFIDQDLLGNDINRLSIFSFSNIFHIVEKMHCFLTWDKTISTVEIFYPELDQIKLNSLYDSKCIFLSGCTKRIKEVLKENGD